MLECHSSIYQVSINDSIYTDLSYYFYEHPSKDQQGLLTTISTDGFLIGENLLKVEKIDRSDSLPEYHDFVSIPFWVAR